MFKKLLLSIVAIIVLGGISRAESYRESTDKYIRDRVVMLLGNKMQCSGIQILSPSGKIYILTASHCDALLNKKKQITAVGELGNHRQVDLVKVDGNSDLMLLTPMDNKYIKVADYSFLHEKIRTITHGASHASYTTYGELIEDKKLAAPTFLIDADHPVSMCPKNAIHKVEMIPMFLGIPILACVVEVQETMSNAFTVGGSSGGAVIDNHGHLVGIVSMGVDDGFSGFVRFYDIKNFLKDY